MVVVAALGCRETLVEGVHSMSKYMLPCIEAAIVSADDDDDDGSAQGAVMKSSLARFVHYLACGENHDAVVVLV